MDEVHKFRRIRHAPPLLAWRRQAPASPWRTGAGFLAVAFVGVALGGSALLGGNIRPFVGVVAAAPDGESARFTLCLESDADSCIIDGDTFRYRGRTIRIADIDTPEVRDFGCASEKARGEAATRRLARLMNAGPFALEPYERDTDRYGRLLRIVTRDGESLGMVLMSEGYARAWDGARRSWCQ